MKSISFDFNNLFSFNIGEKDGVSEKELAGLIPLALQACRHLKEVSKDASNRRRLGLEWLRLVYQKKEELRIIQELGENLARDFENVLFLGIGGSFLGLKAAQDALASPYYNDFAQLRRGRPRIFFEGNNVDPTTLSTLLRCLKPHKTCVVVISKSGKTLETIATFSVVENWLKQSLGLRYGRNIVVITDPQEGILRSRVNLMSVKDPLSFRSLVLLPGVGGRFSELNMGLLHLAILGININEVIAGARKMYLTSFEPKFYKNPALMYATLMYILYKKKNKDISIIMPFSEALKSTGDWYVQLLAESLGKKYARKIIKDKEKQEFWQPDTSSVINVGRTPMAARGTNDLHSIHQNNVEGENNKVITFIRVKEFENDLFIPKDSEFYPGKRFSYLINLAQEATSWSLVKEKRPNCCIALPKINPFYWGQLLFFFEMATAYEGELLNVNAFDQPGVEGYKKYMHFKLGVVKQESLKKEISSCKMIKKDKYVL